MKKVIVAMGAVAAATCALYAASDRLDIYNKQGKFTSIMVDHIEEITIGKDASGNGYSTVSAVTANGTRTKEISEISDIKYVPVNYKEALQIDTLNSAHSQIALLDFRNNTDIYDEAQIDPTKPSDWRGAWPDAMPHFLVYTDKGFASDFAVTGQYTGYVYTDNPNFIFWSLAENNLLGMDSYSFDMPFEPITISTESIELETYIGAPFLGTYKGVNLSYNDSHLSKLEDVLTVEFKYNGTYVVRTTDSNDFKILDLYDWDEKTNTFAYVPYDGPKKSPLDTEIKTGLKGTFYDGIVFAWFHDVLEDKPENTIPYIAARENMTFTMAVGGTYYNHRLVEAKAANGNSRYFYINDANVVREVYMEYVFGNTTLTANCEAYCVLDGEKIFKYVYLGNGNNPTFTFRGKEYGTYSGNGEALFLDGYGKCTLGSLSGRYTIEDGLVNAEFGSEIRIFVVDRTTHEYTEMVSDPWNGQGQYTCEDALGAYNRGDENRLNSIQVEFNKDYSGKDAPGYARVYIDIKRNDGFSRHIGVSSSGKYIYSAETKTVIITNLYIGTSATTAGTGNITFKVSDDMLSMWIDDTVTDRIYATSCDGSYVMAGKVNTLTAPAPAVQLAAKYTGTPNMMAFGSASPTETTLTINSDDSTATLSVKGMGTALINQTVGYEFNGSALTLKGIKSYTAGAYATPVETDLIFTVNADGSLISEQTIVAMAMGMTFDVDFSSSSLNPAE
ncbi:MAG: hypothetical protein HDS91_03420 [Bacteroidales bacterium]|nr:hypothetical protein [Bacteroidales bacterium]